ncbi:DinB family protein [Chitinophaga sp. GCM10012297]|uniref:DinB family protein n=1 Tax=Chitinophaga chungangae TaxID=2821488 RepID=A0ABS3YGH8_9BACT|nr:DinB family protein [Chitinophaga chungangae]MBO9153797.1 DinB family protein [Chitinophaga chungangae]
MQQTTVSPMVYLVQNYADYNLWANERLVNWLRTKPEEVVGREVPSSFPSIQKTLVHIWQTQRYWLSILRKEEAQTYDEYTGTLEDTYSGILEQSREMAGFIRTLNADAVLGTTLIVSPWFQSDFPNFEYIIHAVTHSTYHRGQITTIGRNLGFTDAPMTDYNFYNVNGKN